MTRLTKRAETMQNEDIKKKLQEQHGFEENI